MLHASPTGQQTLLMWTLALAGGEQFLKELPGTISTKSKRQPLVEQGLVDEDKTAVEGTQRKLIRLTLSEKGWTFLSDEQRPVGKSAAAGPVFDGLLSRVLRYLDTHGHVLADLFTEPNPETIQLDEASVTPDRVSLESDEVSTRSRQSAPTRMTTTVENLQRQILEAYQALSAGRSAQRVRLADLRSRLRHTDRTSIDEALRQMVRDGNVVLAPLDHPTDIRASDRDAAILSPLGRPQHLLAIETHALANPNSAASTAHNKGLSHA